MYHSLRMTLYYEYNIIKLIFLRYPYLHITYPVTMHQSTYFHMHSGDEMKKRQGLAGKNSSEQIGVRCKDQPADRGIWLRAARIKTAACSSSAQGEIAANHPRHGGQQTDGGKKSGRQWKMAGKSCIVQRDPACRYLATLKRPRTVREIFVLPRLSL